MIILEKTDEYIRFYFFKYISFFFWSALSSTTTTILFISLKRGDWGRWWCGGVKSSNFNWNWHLDRVTLTNHRFWILQIVCICVCFSLYVWMLKSFYVSMFWNEFYVGIEWWCILMLSVMFDCVKCVNVLHKIPMWKKSPSKENIC